MKKTVNANNLSSSEIFESGKGKILLFPFQIKLCKNKVINYYGC